MKKTYTAEITDKIKKHHKNTIVIDCNGDHIVPLRNGKVIPWPIGLRIYIPRAAKDIQLYFYKKCQSAQT